MADRKLIMTLAKVVIAAAWADGEIAPDEINMYMDTPVDAAERGRLVVELQNELRTGQDKRLAIEALRDVMAADGVVTEEERSVLAEVEAAINDVAVGVAGAMERLVGNRIRERRAVVGRAPNRELFFDDFLRNKVYYSLARHLREEDVALDLSEEEQRKLGLAGGLMAKIAHVDGEITDGEFETMVRTIQTYWALGNTAATFVAGVAVAAVNESYDMTRITSELATAASEAERCQILTVLFAVAAADGEISMDEHEEIRIIARGIKLTHEDFINSKLKVIKG
jgi:uncharacterized tellurite resistance protein B-like protein